MDMTFGFAALDNRKQLFSMLGCRYGISAPFDSQTMPGKELVFQVDDGITDERGGLLMIGGGLLRHY